MRTMCPRHVLFPYGIMSTEGGPILYWCLMEVDSFGTNSGSRLYCHQHLCFCLAQNRWYGVTVPLHQSNKPVVLNIREVADASHHIHQIRVLSYCSPIHQKAEIYGDGLLREAYAVVCQPVLERISGRVVVCPH